jgi:hypothetical protein
VIASRSFDQAVASGSDRGLNRQSKNLNLTRIESNANSWQIRGKVRFAKRNPADSRFGTAETCQEGNRSFEPSQLAAMMDRIGDHPAEIDPCRIGRKLLVIQQQSAFCETESETACRGIFCSGASMTGGLNDSTSGRSSRHCQLLANRQNAIHGTSPQRGNENRHAPEARACTIRCEPVSSSRERRERRSWP